LDIIGPLGSGFNLPAGIQNLLLVSDSQKIAPLLGQMEQGLAVGLAVTLVLGSSRAAGLYPLAALPPAVEFQATTLDGSGGHRGPVTDLLPNLLRWADVVCAVGSTQLYRTLLAQAAATRFSVEPGFAYGLSLDYPIACGVGACLGCTIVTEAGLKLVCVDGPVVDLTALGVGSRE
jgi:dihydroorotate dehydrogenase electron transfer subunit